MLNKISEFFRKRWPSEDIIRAWTLREVEEGRYPVGEGCSLGLLEAWELVRFDPSKNRHKLTAIGTWSYSTYCESGIYKTPEFETYIRQQDLRSSINR